MSYVSRKYAWKDQLWNFSLLPMVKVEEASDPPHGPGPAGNALAPPVPLATSTPEEDEASLARAA